jgi:hypothetical protein
MAQKAKTRHTLYGLTLSVEEADALLAVMESVGGNKQSSRRGLIEGLVDRLREQGANSTDGDLSGEVRFADTRAAAQSVWSQLGLSTAPHRNGPCWCNYGEDYHHDANRIEDDHHHHGHCRERRTRLRAVCELVEKANALCKEGTDA